MSSAIDTSGDGHGSISAGWFRSWAALTLRFPLFFLALALFSMLGSLGFTATHLRFSTDRTQLLDPEHPIQKSWKAFRAEFGGNIDMVVLIVGAPADVRAATEQMGTLLRQDPQTFEQVFYRLDLPEVGKHALYFLSLKDLRKLEAQLNAVEPWLSTAKSGVSGLLDSVTGWPEATARERLTPVLPLFSKVLKGIISSLESRGESRYESPLPAFHPESKMLRSQAYTPGQTTFYNYVRDERTALLLVQPKDHSGSFEADSGTIARLREVVQQLLRSNPRIECMVSGEPVINTDEMVGARNDAMSSGCAAIVLVCILLTMAFGDALRPACATLSLLVGLTWSLAFAAATVGTLNLLTVHFATILVGLSMTFAIQLLAQYQELCSKAGRGRNSNLILQDTLAQTGPQSLIGAVTTAVAFWSLHFTNFRAAGELGLITGTGVFLCFLSITTLLPVLLNLLEGARRSQDARPLRIPGFAALGQFLQDKPWWVMGLSMALTFYSLTWINRVPFNYNVLTMQSKDSDSVHVEKYLQSIGYSSLFAVTTAPTLEKANELSKRFEELGTVSHVESVSQLLPLHIEEKRPVVAEIVRLGKDFRALPRMGQTGAIPDIAPDAPDEPIRPTSPLGADMLLDLHRRFLIAARRLDQLLANMPPSKERGAVQDELNQVRVLLDPKQPGPVEEGLQAYEGALSRDLNRQSSFLHQQELEPPDIIKALPESLRARSISNKGNICLRIFPHADCWEREPLERFVKDIQKVDPGITGTPLLIYFYLEELRNAYSSAGRNALGVICVLLLLHFRSVSESLLALFPKLLGVVWMIGVMGVCDVSFNAANFLALPITLGIGLIFGVNILLECRQGGVACLLGSSTGAAVLISGLTATIGFSSFLMASHRGVSSFGFVMAAGVGANLLTSLFTLPALLTLMARLKSRLKRKSA